MGRGRGLPITSGDPNVPDEYGDMALVGAARSGQVGVIRVLLSVPRARVLEKASALRDRSER